MLIVDATMRRCCWLEGADTVADSASLLSLGCAVALVVVAATAGMQRAAALTCDAERALAPGAMRHAPSMRHA
jgi:hypothetical protein